MAFSVRKRWVDPLIPIHVVYHGLTGENGHDADKAQF
jgi:hypothetical protein